MVLFYVGLKVVQWSNQAAAFLFRADKDAVQRLKRSSVLPFSFPPSHSFSCLFSILALPTRSTAFFNESPDVGLVVVELSRGVSPCNTDGALCTNTRSLKRLVINESCTCKQGSFQATQVMPWDSICILNSLRLSGEGFCFFSLSFFFPQVVINRPPEFTWFWFSQRIGECFLSQAAFVDAIQSELL